MNENETNELSTKYRDEFLLARNKILIEYAKETGNEGKMYFIYSINSQKENTFNATICKEGTSNEIIELKQDQLPNNADVGSILLKNNDRFTLDEKATSYLAEKFENLINELLTKENNELQNKRIEGHKYEVSEVGTDRVFLFDITQDDSNGSEEIEELYISEELIQNLKEGSILIFENGEYKLDEGY